ncbi:hypothetical protein Clacol_003350 [Clathrus columnatus]|uniref:Epoxide hydrolase N-terminal domain-containing protein n=1 Tax=Clathrus columnatus TaxID=1419009 RepID=A0AAV5A7D3_9AGAM|nr:hypothetical protein Clacol_003350 [Clathrus columnatus]
MTSRDLEIDTPKAINVEFPQESIILLKTFLKLTKLPKVPPINTTPAWKLGIDLTWLSQLKSTLESDAWQADKLLEAVNSWPNYLVRMKATDEADEEEFVDLHFMHIKSGKPNAIPLLMVHGWPGTSFSPTRCVGLTSLKRLTRQLAGTFWDFHKVIEPLTNPPAGQPAFDLILPSLPGYFLSTLPQRYNWTLVHIATLFHKLMTKILKYPNGLIAISYLRAVILGPAVNNDNAAFTEAELHALKRGQDFWETGRGYIEIQSTKPFTIGIAIATSPVALLTYIGEKMYMWSDPSKLDPVDVINNVVLYYLSGCFPTSVMIYHQGTAERNQMRALHNGEAQWKVKSKIGFTLFIPVPHTLQIVSAAPRAYIQAAGPLVFYKERSSGGHFAALDNPDGLVEDLREFLSSHWEN